MRERLIRQCVPLVIPRGQLGWLLSVTPRTVSHALKRAGLALRPGRPPGDPGEIERDFPNLPGLLASGLPPQEASKIYTLPLRDVLRLIGGNGGRG